MRRMTVVVHGRGTIKDHCENLEHKEEEHENNGGKWMTRDK